MSRPVRILVVDDNIDQVQTMALLLHAMGHEVRFAINGESALGEARGFMPDVVFVDLGLPDIEGQDLCRQLCREPELRKHAPLRNHWLRPTRRLGKCYRRGL